MSYQGSSSKMLTQQLCTVVRNGDCCMSPGISCCTSFSGSFIGVALFLLYEIIQCAGIWVMMSHRQIDGEERSLPKDPRL